MVDLHPDCVRWAMRRSRPAASPAPGIAYQLEEIADYYPPRVLHTAWENSVVKEHAGAFGSTPLSEAGQTARAR